MVAAEICLSAQARVTVSIAAQAVGMVWEIKISSIPALIAAAALFAVPKYVCIAFISMQSLITKPLNPSSSFNKPVTIFFEMVAGNCSSMAGKRICEMVTAGSCPVLMTCAKGAISISSSSALDLRTAGNVRCESTDVSPCPGKCFAALSSPPAVSPRTI